MNVNRFFQLKDDGKISVKHIDFDNGYGAVESFYYGGIYYMAVFHKVDAITWNGSKKIVIPRGWVKSEVHGFFTKEDANSFYINHIKNSVA